MKAVNPTSRAVMQWGVHACMLLVAGFMLVYGAHLCYVTWGNTIAEFPRCRPVSSTCRSRSADCSPSCSSSRRCGSASRRPTNIMYSDAPTELE